MKKILIAGMLALATMIAGCNDADIASENISKAADNFEVMRRVVFINGITDQYMLEIVGLCSRGNNDGASQVTITCKTGPKKYVKHFLGLSDNVTYMIEQLEGIDVSVNHYRVTFKPQTILPDIDLRIDLQEAVTPRAQ